MKRIYIVMRVLFVSVFLISCGDAVDDAVRRFLVEPVPATVRLVHIYKSEVSMNAPAYLEIIAEPSDIELVLSRNEVSKVASIHRDRLKNMEADAGKNTLWWPKVNTLRTMEAYGGNKVPASPYSSARYFFVDKKSKRLFAYTEQAFQTWTNKD